MLPLTSFGHSRNANSSNMLIERTSSIIPKVNEEKDPEENLLTQSVRVSTNTKNLATCNDKQGTRQVPTATLASFNRSSNENGHMTSTNVMKSGMTTDPPTQLLSTQGNNRLYFLSSGADD